MKLVKPFMNLAKLKSVGSKDAENCMVSIPLSFSQADVRIKSIIKMEKSMESMKEMQINTNIESDKNSGGIDMSSDSIRSTGTTGSGSSVEMVVDSVIMSGRSGWSDSDVYSPISTSLTST